MKKVLYLFFAFALLAGKCKKDKTDDNGSEEQTYECLVKKIVYTDHNDATENEQTVYTYNENAIKSKTRTFSDGTSYKYNYYYTDQTKGLLERIDIIIQGTVVAKLNYTIQNGKITQRALVVLANDNVTWLPAWEVYYTYNGDKVNTVQIVDHDLWNQGANPTDETGVYTYTGDNLTNSKWYDTSDMNTLKEEFNYQYDQGKRAFDNVVTQTYPKTRVNNIIHMEHNVYGTNPSTEITNTAITYNNKGFPTKYEVTDDRGNPLNTEDVEYDNCN